MQTNESTGQRQPTKRPLTMEASFAGRAKLETRAGQPVASRPAPRQPEVAVKPKRKRYGAGF